MELYDFDARLNRPVRVKLPDFQAGDRLRHVIYADQFTRALIERLARSADRIRTIAKSKEGSLFLTNLLPHKRAMMYFTQPSTRTFLSFMAACQLLGLSCNEVRDTATSSEAKGESPFDSVRMFSSYFDLIIMRSKVPQFAECCAYMMNDLEQSSRRGIPIVNAGSGADEHPTQALLDMYSIQRVLSFENRKDSRNWTWFDDLRNNYPNLRKGVDGKVFGFCGDICRGRTIRSLARLLSLYNGVTLYFVSPKHPSLSLPGDLKTELLNRGATVREFESFEEQAGQGSVIEELDVLYMTRIQKEHNSPSEEQEFKTMDFSRYKLTPKRVASMKRYAAILHPFPRDAAFGEIPTLIDTDQRAFYFRQARHGMWIRCALLAYLFDVETAISDFFDEYTRSFHQYNLGAG